MVAVRWGRVDPLCRDHPTTSSHVRLRSRRAPRGGEGGGQWGASERDPSCTDTHTPDSARVSGPTPDRAELPYCRESRLPGFLDSLHSPLPLTLPWVLGSPGIVEVLKLL